MNNLICVEFIKANPPWVPGKLAGFDQDTAFALVLGGKAKFVTPPPGLDEYGQKVRPPDAPVKPKPKRKAKAKPKPKAKR